MKNCKLKASFFLDGMAALMLVGLICLVLIPMMNQMRMNFYNEVKSIDVSKTILTAASTNSKNKLKKGVIIGEYVIKLDDKQICAITNKNSSKFKECIQY
ncbi:competence protein ComGE [Staphylococcus sp. SS87]|nr:competence protein ComGE [Staphylococcus singaporensis]